MHTNTEACQYAYTKRANASASSAIDGLHIVFALNSDEVAKMTTIGPKLDRWPVYYDANVRPLEHGDVCRIYPGRGLIRVGQLAW